MTRFFHLSDLHFGRIEERALGAMRRTVARARPDALIITGDLTQSGRRSEFAAAATFLQSLDRPTAIVPGNHDTPVYNLLNRFFQPWKRFETHFGPATPRVWAFSDTAIIGINSARRAAPRLNWSYGRLRRRDIRAADSLARDQVNQGKLVFVASHHPFKTGPGRAGAEPVGRADLAIERFVDAGIAAVLTGHTHSSEIVPLEASNGTLLSISSGSATSTRQRDEAASFTEIDTAPADDSDLHCIRYAFDGSVFQPRERHCLKRENRVWRFVGERPAA